MVLADYRCGCTWVGEAEDCLDYCGKHGEDRRRLHNIGRPANVEKGWCWQLEQDKVAAAG